MADRYGTSSGAAEYYRLRESITAYCGLDCTHCAYREEQNCGGCIATEGHPFYGECQVAECAKRKKRGFCGECADFDCDLLKSYSSDEVHGDTPKGARIRNCAEVKAAMRRVARQGIDPVSVCGHHCDHCFLGQWCGGCRSVYPNCSFATLFEDDSCPNVTCAGEKRLDGCYDCPELADCQKGYYSADDFYMAKGAALFIQQHGKKAYTAVHETMEKRKEDFCREARSAEDVLTQFTQALEGIGGGGSLHKVFGKKQNVGYVDRKGAYLVPIREGKVAVVKTGKGYFLLGGGIEAGETDEECVIRECLEEAGCEAQVERRVCFAETYGDLDSAHPAIEYFHPVQTYYLGKLLGQVQPPSEKDHALVWVPYEELRGNLFVEMQNWALDRCWESAQK